MAAIAVRKKVISIGHFSPCFRLQSLQFFYLLEEIKSNCMYWMHWKSEKNRTEPNELEMTSYAHWDAFLYLHAQTSIKTSIHLSDLKSEKKDWAKWAKWARILKSTLNNKQLHSGTCFLVFACSIKHQYTSLLILHKIVKNRKKFNLNFT